MYGLYSGKTRTDSNLAWHRPQSALCRLEQELIEKSQRELPTTTDPVERLRLLCLSRGATGILDIGRTFRKKGYHGCRKLNKREFINGVKDSGLDLSDQHADEIFAKFDPENTGLICVEDFLKQLRPPMSEARTSIVEQAFRKLDKTGNGELSIQDIRNVYSAKCNPGFMNGDETEDFVVNRFLANFETEGAVDEKVTLEEFMNYYSGIGVSVDKDAFFDLMIRQAYKL